MVVFGPAYGEGFGGAGAAGACCMGGASMGYGGANVGYSNAVGCYGGADFGNSNPSRMPGYGGSHGSSYGAGMVNSMQPGAMGSCAYNGKGCATADNAANAEEEYGGFSLEWQEQLQEEWQQQIQAQYFSRWSVDKQDEWQAYQTAFEAQAAAPLGQQVQPSSQVSELDPRVAEEYRRRHEMRVISAFSGGTLPAPVITFDRAPLPPGVLQEVTKANFTEPTPIQAQCWPILTAGHDLIGIAKSGSGKTLAFLVPGFASVLRRNTDAQRGPGVLVLAPTRELAHQIQLEALKFGRSSGVLCCAVTGGEPKGEQLEWIRHGCHVIVATPGRLNEFLQQKYLWLGQVGYLVLDEADRMLDMGFEPQIRRIIEECPRGADRQTLLFSATWPKAVRQLAFDFLRRPFHVHIGEMHAAKANTDITQNVLLLGDATDKDKALEDTLEEYLPDEELAIVFVATKRACQDMAHRSFLRKFGVAEIHGDKDQRQRDDALHSFVSRKQRILVATDVASRGLDIRGVALVVNYDAANTAEDHVHRIGRTGRAGEKGTSFTFLVRNDADDTKRARAVLEVMEQSGQTVPEDLRQLAGTPVRGGGVSRGRGRGGFRGRGGSKGGKGSGGYKGGGGGNMKGAFGR